MLLVTWCRFWVILSLLLGLAVCALFLAWELHNAAGVTYSHWGFLGKSAGDDYDEGAYVVSAQLLLKGYPLFHAVFSAQPVLFLPSLAIVVRVVSNPVVAGHLYEALAGLAALAGVFWMAWSAYRPLAAPLAAALLAISPGFLLYAHAVEAEMPMLGLCTLAVAAAQSYYLTGRRSMAALCGFLLMAGTEIKLLSIVVVAPLALLLLGGAWRRYRLSPTRATRALAADALAFVLPLTVPALLLLALVAPADQLRQVVAFHLAASQVMPLNSAANVQALGAFLGYDPGLLVVAVVGAVVALLRARHHDRYLPLVYALWFLTTLLFLWRYHPLLQHQFVPLLPPLALLGAAVIVPYGRTVISRQPSAISHQPSAASRQPLRGRASLKYILPVLSALAGLVYLGLLGVHTLPGDEEMFIRVAMPNRDQLSRIIDQHTRPSDFVVCDDPMVALTAHRLLAPGMEDPSMVRIAAGYLTAGEAITATVRYHVAAIVVSRPKYVGGQLAGSVFSYSLPGYMAWVRRHYRSIPLPVSIPAAAVYLRR